MLFIHTILCKINENDKRNSYQFSKVNCVPRPSKIIDCTSSNNITFSIACNVKLTQSGTIKLKAMILCYVL